MSEEKNLDTGVKAELMAVGRSEADADNRSAPNETPHGVIADRVPEEERRARGFDTLLNRIAEADTVGRAGSG